MSIRTNFISFLLTAALATPAIAQTYTVKSGDSLWKIAEKTKAENVTVHQMIAAIHESNSSLLGADIGNIKPGMELQIPTSAEAINANSAHATTLLGGPANQVHGLPQSDRIDSIHKQISRIETEINQTVKAIEASQYGFEQMITPQEKVGQ